MTDTISASSRQSLWRIAESLWVAALGAQIIVPGTLLLPRIIRLLGRGGAAETVEWAVYMATLFVFPVLIWIVGWGLPRTPGAAAASFVKRALVVLTVVEFAAYAVLRSTPLLVVAAIVASIAGALAIAGVRSMRSAQRPPVAAIAVAIACGIAGWMAGGGLVYWENALSWVFRSPATIAALVVCLVIVAGTMRKWIDHDPSSHSAIRVLDFIPLAVLVLFSFRTNPMVEFYHWGFFIGPIDSVRQGGTLLWDTPSQYGFLSILLPASLPGNSWQSFWFVQAVVYAIVASMMYLALRKLSSGWWGAVAAFIITFTALFFRPRTATLLLPAQMTPAAGPYRFIWCFVMLAFLVQWRTRDHTNDKPSRFALTGTGIWIVACLWSAESAIYVTAMWFPALLMHTIQTVSAPGLTSGEKLGLAAKNIALPFIGLLVAGMTVFAAYVALGLKGPDMLGHAEYVLLYSSGGFGALPIDPTGTVWYLILSFLILATIFALHAKRNLLDPRLIVWAAAWGGIWSIASYFTGRSHPVNLIALVPMLIFILAVCMGLRPFADSLHGRYAMAGVMLPLLVMPATLTLGHRSFPAGVSERQLPPSAFTEQLPLMDEELQSLLTGAGAKPTDSFVLISDGRLLLPAWRMSQLPAAVGNPDARRVFSTTSWMAKPFEIIGSLPADRRLTYLHRDAESFPRAGWFIENRKLVAAGSEDMLDFVKANRPERARIESPNWIVRRMGPSTTPQH